MKSTSAGGRPPGERAGAGGRASIKKPTDMELMLYFDGELNEARRAEVEAYIESDTGAKGKLLGLEMTSGIVREQSLASDMGFDITASVMSRIEADAGALPAKDGGGAGIVDIRDARRSVRDRAAPANDNSRSIFTLAAIAVAAAAGMMIWGRMGAEPVRSADNRPTTAQAAPAEPVPVASSDAALAEAPAPEGDMEHGVEVAAVDFGAHMGTIFYVPTGAAVSSATTTVVWVDDEVAGGK